VGKFEENEFITEGSTIRILKNPNIAEPSSSDATILSKMHPTDLSKTLQYGQGYGDSQLREWAREHVKVEPYSTLSESRWSIHLSTRIGTLCCQLGTLLLLKLA
jgi:hypothetical protein